MAATHRGSGKPKPPRKRRPSNPQRRYRRTARMKRDGAKKNRHNPLHGLQNPAKVLVYRSRLPELNDPLEEPCVVADPMPENYVFVPRGDPYVTRNCKVHSKNEASTVFIVYDNKVKDKLGIRVPKNIYRHVTDLASQTADKRAAAVLSQDLRHEKKAKKLLDETFPDIPPEFAKEILQHAFLKGSGRVGRSTTQPDTLKARLAVEAYIRHRHTPYEKLLDDGMDRDDARKAVRKTVHALRDQWAGKSKLARSSKLSSDSQSPTTESLAKEGPRRSTRLRPRPSSPEVIVID